MPVINTDHHCKLKKTEKEKEKAEKQRDKEFLVAQKYRFSRKLFWVRSEKREKQKEQNEK